MGKEKESWGAGLPKRISPIGHQMSLVRAKEAGGFTTIA
jgi:hypothetical protein